MKNLLINLIYSQNNANSVNINVPFGKYSGIIIKKSGFHSSTVVAGDITDNILINVGGVQIVNASMFSLININKFTYGFIPETIGRTFAFNCFIPIEFISSNDLPAGILINNIFAGSISNEISIYGILNIGEIHSSETIIEFNKYSRAKELFEFDGARMIYLYSGIPSSFSTVEIIDAETNEILVLAPYTVTETICNIFTNSISDVEGVLIDIGQYRKIKVIITSNSYHNYKILYIGLKV